MKKGLTLLMVLILCLGAPAAQASAPTLSYPAAELSLPAAGLMLYVPTDMASLGGDEEAYDLGFRFNCYSDTFDLTVYVKDSRDMSLADYGAFYAERSGTKAAADNVNGYAVQLMTSTEKPNDYTVIVAAPDQEIPDVVYLLEFSCGSQSDVNLAEEIINTLAPYKNE